MGEAGRAMLKSVEKANRPDHYTLASDIPQEGSLQERASTAWNSLPAESPGRRPHPVMPLCSLESGGTDPETISSWVQKDHKDHLRTLGMPTPLGTHLTVHLAGTWLSCCFQQIPNPSISLVMLWKVPGKKKKNSPKELVFGSSGLVISFPNEPVERWICRPIPLPAQCPVHHLPGRTGGERKGDGSLRVALASVVTSSSCPKQWPLSVLHFNDSSYFPQSPHQLPALRKRESRRRRKGF